MRASRTKLLTQPGPARRWKGAWHWMNTCLDDIPRFRNLSGSAVIFGNECL